MASSSSGYLKLNPLLRSFSGTTRRLSNRADAASPRASRSMSLGVGITAGTPSTRPRVLASSRLRTGLGEQKVKRSFQVLISDHKKTGRHDVLQMDPWKPLAAVTQWAADEHPECRQHFFQCPATFAQHDSEPHNHCPDAVFFRPQGLFFPLLADLRQIPVSGRLGLPSGYHRLDRRSSRPPRRCTKSYPFEPPGHPPRCWWSEYGCRRSAFYTFRPSADDTATGQIDDTVDDVPVRLPVSLTGGIRLYVAEPVMVHDIVRDDVPVATT